MTARPRQLSTMIRTPFARTVARLLIVSLIAQLSLFSERAQANPRAAVPATSPGLPAAVSIFGPRDYVRTTGKPASVSETFTVRAPGTYVLRIQNRGSRQQYAPVSSAVVTLNGVVVVAPNEFNPQVILIAKPVVLAATNTLTVELRSKPDSGFTLEIVGESTNHAPIADAGPDQTVHVGQAVTLDGSRSADADGDTLSYRWMFLSRPAGSAAALSNPSAVAPGFVADRRGDYVVQLVVNDGTFDSAPDTVTVSTTNSAPVADAGPDQAVLVGAVVTLDGSGSHDVDGDALTFQWALISRPAGSAAGLSSTSSAKPTFTVDVAGTYVARLIVNDGLAASAPDTVTVSTTNSAPVANAGPDQTTVVGAVVTLDGTGSRDADGDALSYRWAFTSRPPGSAALLSNPTNANPTFTVDAAGSYLVQLIVNDGLADSAPDSVTITTLNSKPVAKAGPNQTVTAGDTVTLDGTGSSDADRDPLTFRWAMLSKPAASTAVLSNPAAAKPTFVANVAGTYLVQLIVNDGQVDSSPDTTTINARAIVPNVVGRTEADARAAIVDAKLVVGTVTTQNSDTTPAGNVISEMPPAGSVVDAGSAIDLVVSSGPAMSIVPDVTGRSQAEASAMLAAVHLTLGAVTNEFSATIPAGNIIRQSPAAGSSVRQGSAVDVVVSLGPRPNRAPIADAGADQPTLVGQLVTLDGSKSSDPDGDPLTFFWSVVSLPAGSSARLSDAAAVRPTFTADRPGAYVFELKVSDGRLMSAPSRTTVTTGNSRPIADAGADQTARVGTTVTLDGGKSSDPDGDPLTFKWTFASRPAGSTATLSDPTAVSPTFVVDRAGVYIAQLVVNDGKLDSLPASVKVSTTNSAPVADAGPNQTVFVGTVVTLDGSKSHDVDGDPLTFRWALTSRPAGSTATLSDPKAVMPTFTVDKFGTYIAQLMVNDGTVDSAPATVTISTKNSAPVADAGPAQTVFVGTTITLDGSKSHDVDGDPLTYKWAFTSLPAGSTATLSSPTVVAPTFTVDVAGTYIVRLTVNDGTVDSAPSPVTISTKNSAPIADAGPPQTVFVGTTVTLDGSNSNDADRDSLTFRWSFVSRPAGSVAAFSDSTAVKPTFLVDTPGDYVVQLIVNDGTVDSAPKTVTISTKNSKPVAKAGPRQTVTAGDTVTLDGTGSSDADRDPLTFRWSMLSKPAGSSATLSNSAAPKPTFVADLAGTYVVQLIVNDGTVDSDPDTTTIEAKSANVIVPALAGKTQADANAALVAVGLKLGTVTTENSDSVPEGQVIRQTPAAGTPVPPQSAVDVVISKGPVVPVLRTITVAPANRTITRGSTQQYTATGTFSDGSTQDFTATAQWESTNLPIASITSGGLAEGRDVGTTIIRATKTGITGSTNLTVDPAALASIVVTPANSIALAGDSVSFVATGVLTDGTSQSLAGQVMWNSSDQLKASINQTTGVAMALAGGPTTISATKGAVVGTTLFTVQDKVSDPTPPSVAITSPLNNATILAATNIVGTASDANFSKYVLEVAPAGSTAFTTIATGTSPVVNGVLGVLDPSLLVNDLYTVQVKVFDRGGNIGATSRVYQVSRDVKVGNFTLTFQDLSVPMSGLPITVNRVYDSRDKRVGDFGVGWRLDIQTLRLRTNDVLGSRWQGTRSGGFIPTYCVQPADEHKVSITLADGTVEEFDMTIPGGACQQLIPPNLVDTPVSFTARPGTRGSLVALDGPTATIFGSFPGPVDLYGDFSLLDLYNPQTFQYTSYEGRVFVINKTAGVQSVTDPNGNKLTFTANGILHSSGASVTFTRDAQGRITKMTAPDGKVINYTYDVNGDLSTHADPAGNTTRYFYNLSHGVIEVRDPRGLRPLRNEYDASGRLVAHIDAQGRRVEYSHVIGSRQEIVQDRNGGQTVYEYDAQGNIIKITDALGKVTTYTYDARGNKLSETNPLGQTTTYTYDANNNPTSEQDALGNTTTRTFNARGQILAQTDPLGRTTTNVYNATGNLTSAKDAAGNITTFSYDPQGNPTSIVNPLGHTTTIVYDANGRQTQKTDPLGNAFSATYDAGGRKLTETDPRGKVTRFTYDAAGRETAVENPLGQITRSEYDAVGNTTATINALGQRTEFTYDQASRLLATKYPDGTEVRNTYDAEGNLIAVVDQQGRTTEFTYDGKKQRLSMKHPDGSIELYTYDAAGRMLTARDPLGNVAESQYDAAGRETKTIDPLGNTASMTYDAADNLMSRTDPNGHTTQFTYDQNNRMTRMTVAGGQTTDLVYDAAGRQTSETDGGGRTTQFAYDANGRVTTVTDAAGGVTRFEYDALGDRTALVDARGNRTTFTYNAANQMTAKALPNGGVEQFTYDAAGRLVAKQDPMGRTTSYRYDSVGRQTTRTYPDGSKVQFTYTASGRRATAVDGRGTTSYTYDVRDRLTKLTYPDGQEINYSYDAAGNLLSISSLAGTISYIYVKGRLQQVTDPAGRAITFTYDAAGNRTGLTYPNGTKTSYAYDVNDRLTRLTHTGPAALLADYVYTLGPAGNRTRIEESTGAIKQYSYDALYRLVQEQVTDLAANPIFGNAFTYDAVGNRTTRTLTAGAAPPVTTSYIYNNADQLLTESGVSYAYDLNGNLTTRTDAAGVTTYAYDFENRLTRVAPPSGAATVYVYDADGNRVEKRDASGVVRYLVDTNRQLAQVLAEYSPAGAVIASYVYVDDLISMTRGGQTAFYHFDGIGSTRLLTNLAGGVTDTYDYDAFGNLVSRTGTTDNPFLFTGQALDANSGFYYLRARMYQPSTGRFLTVDAHGGLSLDPRSLHRYVYALNDPVNRTDPSGQFSLGSLSISISISGILRGIASLSVGVLIDYVLAKLTGAEFNLWVSIGTNLAFGAVGKGLSLGVNAVRRSPNTFRLLQAAARRGQAAHAAWFEMVKKARAAVGQAEGFCPGCFTVNKAIRDAAGNVVKSAKGKIGIPDFVDYATHTIVDLKPVPKAIYDAGQEAINEYCNKTFGAQMRKYIEIYKEARGVDIVNFFWDAYPR